MRLKALQHQFRQHPTLQSMVQSYLGIEAASGPAMPQTDDEIQAEFAQLGLMGLL